MKRGSGNIKAVYAKNFTSKQAQARMDATIKPMQRQGLNALAVDSYPVLYYQNTMSTLVCTCQQTELTEGLSQISTEMPPNAIDQESEVGSIISIDHSRPLFGFRSDMPDPVTPVPDMDFTIDEHHSNTTHMDVVDSLFQASTDCGICYKTGFVPGYSLYGQVREVLTTHSIADLKGFFIKVSEAPHRLQRLNEEGWVKFSVDIPKYLKQVRYSVRNNRELLSEEPLWTAVDGQQDEVVTLDYLLACRGSYLEFKVKAEEFTHVVLEFDTGCDPVIANIAQLSKTMDWTLFDSIGNVNITLPMTIPDLHAHDVIFVPKIRSTFKITDFQYARTSHGGQIEWSCSTRVLQPQECLKLIHKSRTLL